MRSHAKIIVDAGGSATVQQALGLGSPHTVTSWRQRDSIPGEHWKAFADHGFATLDELALAAEARKRPLQGQSPSHEAA